MKKHRLDQSPKDRSGWPKGPWDDEPDYEEWTTAVGYEAYCTRLDTGAWVGIIIAPLPSGVGYVKHKFYNALHNIRRNIMDHQIGVVGPSDREDWGEYCLSMEHWECPGESRRDWFRGPYKKLTEVKQIVEEVAEDIFGQINKAQGI